MKNMGIRFHDIRKVFTPLARGIFRLFLFRFVLKVKIKVYKSMFSFLVSIAGKNKISLTHFAWG